jgi:2-amino-4-hydroxy-6-hydroxymethyldihydropteridine diphosphokinase
MAGYGQNDVFLLLGSNLGDRLQNINQAQTRISGSVGGINHKSSVYRTAPWGVTNQPEFLNQVVLVKTDFNPQQLLRHLLKIEQEMGRVRDAKWGPRVIDIDILFFNNELIDEKNLNIPHPGIPDRKFTLIPLVEIAPDFIHPVLLRKLSLLLEECDDASIVTKANL